MKTRKASLTDGRAQARHRILVVGPVPPPAHGAAHVTEYVWRRLAQDRGVELVDTACGTPRSTGSGYLLRRLQAHGRAATTVRRCRGDLNAVYIGGAGGLGLVLQLVVILAARLSDVPVYFHHHSYAYVTSRRLTMSAISVFGAPNTVHVALGAKMRDQLLANYPAIRRAIVCSNEAVLPAPGPTSVRHHNGKRSFVLGHLSNLSVEKGLGTLLGALSSLLARGLDVRLVLAGPCASQREKALVDHHLSLYPHSLIWQGRLDRRQVPEFMESLDLFVFPSTYEHEAQPLVVLEAARCGTPTIAFDVGELGSASEGTGTLVSPAASFSDAVEEVVRAGPTSAQTRSSTINAFRNRQDLANVSYEALFNELSQHVS